MNIFSSKFSLFLTTALVVPLAALSANKPAETADGGIAPRLATNLITQLDSARNALLTDQNNTGSLKAAIDGLSNKLDSSASTPLETQLDTASTAVGNVSSADGGSNPALADLQGKLAELKTFININNPSLAADLTTIRNVLRASNNDNVRDVLVYIRDTIASGSAASIGLDNIMGIDVTPPDPANLDQPGIRAGGLLGSDGDQASGMDSKLSLDEKLRHIATAVLKSNFDFNAAPSPAGFLIDSYYSVLTGLKNQVDDNAANPTITDAVVAVMGDAAASPATYGIIGNDTGAGNVNTATNIHDKLDAIIDYIDPAQSDLYAAIASISAGFGY